MKLGLVFGYWGAGPQPDFVERAQEAERLGYDSVWVAESWGNDAFTFGAWVAAHTSTIKIGTGVVQLAARTPTATAMAAVNLVARTTGDPAGLNGSLIRIDPALARLYMKLGRPADAIELLAPVTQFFDKRPNSRGVTASFAAHAVEDSGHVTLEGE